MTNRKIITLPKNARTTLLRSGSRVPPRRRALLSELSKHLGRETLHIRIYRDGPLFIYERRIEARDGVSVVAVLVGDEVSSIDALLRADPYYDILKSKAEGWSRSLNELWLATNGESSA